MIDEEYKCWIWNYCSDKDLCCSFCNRKNCDERCLDDPAKCNFYMGDKKVLKKQSKKKKTGEE